MNLKTHSLKKGFTLIELMVVIVIIGILVAIAIPNMIAAQDRAKLSSVKSNMHVFQTILETYAVDWQGRYPANTKLLHTDAVSKNYNKEAKNPFNSAKASLTTQKERGIVGTLNADGTYTRTGVAMPDTSLSIPLNLSLNSGTVIYVPFDSSNSVDADITDTSISKIVNYNLYGVALEGEGNRLLQSNGGIFTLTNS